MLLFCPEVKFSGRFSLLLWQRLFGKRLDVETASRGSNIDGENGRDDDEDEHVSPGPAFRVDCVSVKWLCHLVCSNSWVYPLYLYFESIRNILKQSKFVNDMDTTRREF